MTYLPGAGGSWRAIIAGDFDNDGLDDVVGVTTNPGLSIFFSNGNGTFRAGPANAGAGSINFDGHCTGLALADLNNDGTLDLLAVNAGSVYVLHNAGNGLFDLMQTLASSRTCYGFNQAGVSIGDINGDGFVDFVTSSSFGLPYLFRNLGDGTFVSAYDPSSATGRTTSGATLVDLDLDGQLDLVTSVRASGYAALQVYKGNNSGTFAGPPATYPSLGVESLWSGRDHIDGRPVIVSSTGAQKLQTFRLVSGCAP